MFSVSAIIVASSLIGCVVGNEYGKAQVFSLFVDMEDFDDGCFDEHLDEDGDGIEADAKRIEDILRITNALCIMIMCTSHNTGLNMQVKARLLKKRINRLLDIEESSTENG